jgi:hypothetical protein
MSKDYATQPYTQVRYAKRSKDDERWIKDFLGRAPMGVLATVYEGQPFINSNLFVYDEVRHLIYMHTARDGRTRSNVEGASRVCFSVSEMGRILPADEALEFSVEYGGVTVFGEASIIEDPETQRHALQLLLDKYAPHLRPGEHYRPTTDEELARTTVYQISIDQWSGKGKTEAEDFPGAFTYPYQGEQA